MTYMYYALRLMQFADNEIPDEPVRMRLADLGLCPLIESKDSVVYVDEQGRSGLLYLSSQIARIRKLIWFYAVRITV